MADRIESDAASVGDHAPSPAQTTGSGAASSEYTRYQRRTFKSDPVPEHSINVNGIPVAHTPGHPLQVVGVCRFTQGPQDKLSNRDQQSMLKEWLPKLVEGDVEIGWTWLTAEAESGEKKNRRTLDELRNLITSRAISVVIAESPSRIARNARIMLELFDLCRAHQVRLLTQQFSFDSANDGSRVMLAMGATFDEVRVEQDSQHHKRTRAARFQDAAYYTHLPFGYELVQPEGYEGRRLDEHVRVIEELRPVCIEMVEVLRESLSYAVAAKFLNEGGHQHPKGGFWTSPRVRKNS